MRVYVAGPYTKGDVVVNVRKAIECADSLVRMGHEPFIPHLSHLWHTISPHEYTYWMDRDLAWLDVCDALVRIPGDSAGADKEMAYAHEHGIPVYEGLDKFIYSEAQ